MREKEITIRKQGVHIMHPVSFPSLFVKTFQVSLICDDNPAPAQAPNI